MFENPFLDDVEIRTLAQQHGTPHAIHVALEVGVAFWGPWENKWPWRRGEVMFLLPRPGGLLLHRKAHYPANAWRLLTGGIELNETVAGALEREPFEEVGLILPTVRYVGIISYDVNCEGRHYPFATHIFLLGYSDAPLNPSHDDEIAETHLATLTDLEKVAANLETLPDPKWQDWGRFRAVAHRKVADWLTPEEVLPPAS
jgi:8-oxo-dGTP pyrophosphatase MutT (NUDIX family)